MKNIQQFSEAEYSFMILFLCSEIDELIKFCDLVM